MIDPIIRHCPKCGHTFVPMILDMPCPKCGTARRLEIGLDRLPSSPVPKSIQPVIWAGEQTEMTS